MNALDVLFVVGAVFFVGIEVVTLWRPIAWFLYHEERQKIDNVYYIWITIGWMVVGGWWALLFILWSFLASTIHVAIVMFEERVSNVSLLDLKEAKVMRYATAGDDRAQLNEVDAVVSILFILAGVHMATGWL